MQRPEISVFAIVLAAIGGVLGAAGGCASERAPASDTMLILGVEGDQTTATMSAGQREAVVRAMYGVADGTSARGDSIVTGPSLELAPTALIDACDVAGVEMAIAATAWAEDRTSVVFTLRTVDGLPAELTVAAAETERGYHASAWVGHFRDQHTERAARLLREFDREMSRWARKRRFRTN